MLGGIFVRRVVHVAITRRRNSTHLPSKTSLSPFQRLNFPNKLLTSYLPDVTLVGETIQHMAGQDLQAQKIYYTVRYTLEELCVGNNSGSGRSCDKQVVGCQESHKLQSVLPQHASNHYAMALVSHPQKHEDQTRVQLLPSCMKRSGSLEKRGITSKHLYGLARHLPGHGAYSKVLHAAVLRQQASKKWLVI